MGSALYEVGTDSHVVVGDWVLGSGHSEQSSALITDGWVFVVDERAAGGRCRTLLARAGCDLLKTWMSISFEPVSGITSRR